MNTTDRHHRTSLTLGVTFALLVSLASVLGFLQGGAVQAAERSPCDLVSAAEAEAVLGPLAGPPFRASNGQPAANGDSCLYETPAFRSIAIRVEWTDGGQTFGVMNLAEGTVSEGGMKGVLTLSDGTELTGEWDEARVFMCCEFNALRGEQLVAVDISGSRATVEQAAMLADAALRRLDQPLQIDDAQALAEAERRAATRPAIRPVCELLTRADAEEIAGASLLAEPQGDESSCTYAWMLPGEGFEYELTLQVGWRGGFSGMRLTQAAIGQTLSFLKSEGADLEQEQADSGLFDEEASSIIGVMAVKSDVLLSIETGGFRSDLAHAFIAKAASKL